MFFRKVYFLIVLHFILALNVSAQYNFNKYLADAMKDMNKNNFTEAIKKLNICIQANPAELQSYFYRGVCKYFLNDNLGALNDLNQATSNYNNWYYDACHYRALVKDRLEDYEGAIKDYNLIIDKQPNEPLLYLERSFSKLSSRDYTGAIRDCNKALSLQYFSEDLYLCRGAAETELNNYENALKDFDQVLSINPRNQNAYVRRGIAKSSAGNPGDAIEDYNAALKIDSGCTFAYYNRASALIAMKDFKGAIRDYNLLLKYEPDNALTYYNKAVIETNLGEYKSALEDFNHVLSLNPKNIQALFNRAKVKQALKNYRGAIADYDKAIELFPYFTEAYYEKSLLKKMLGDAAGAKKDFELGKMMSEMNHAKNMQQVVRDSVLLTHLTDLNADFNSSISNADDTVNIQLLSIYYLAFKDSAFKNSMGNQPVILKKSKRDYNSFYLTNTDSPPKMNSTDNLNTDFRQESGDSGKQTENGLLKIAIQKTNMLLLNDAVSNYNKLIEQDSSNAIAYFQRGVNACKEVELLNRFSNDLLLPNQPKTVVKSQRDEIYEQALADFNKTIELEPSFAIAFYNRAYVKCQLHDFNGAIKDYDNAISSDASLASAYYNRGLFLLHLQDKLHACGDFSKAGELGLTESYSVIKKYCPRSIEK